MTVYNLKMYLALLEIANNAADELNISYLTNADKEVLLHIWNTTNHGYFTYHASFDEILKMSKSQYHKSIKRLTTAGLLDKIGTERSATYQVNATR